MFDSLTERLQGAFKKLTGQARISDAVLKESLREVRMALLEADVHIGVVKELTNAVRVMVALSSVWGSSTLLLVVRKKSLASIWSESVSCCVVLESIVLVSAATPTSLLSVDLMVTVRRRLPAWTFNEIESMGMLYSDASRALVAFGS